MKDQIPIGSFLMKLNVPVSPKEKFRVPTRRLSDFLLFVYLGKRWILHRPLLDLQNFFLLVDDPLFFHRSFLSLVSTYGSPTEPC